MRSMTAADLNQVMAIEKTSFRFPWSAGFFLEELQAEYARSLLVEIEGRVVGYVLFWCLPDEVDIHNVAVHSDFRRRGIGRILVGHAVEQARRWGSVRVTLEVRKSNVQAQRLYESLGFLVTGVRKGYYADDGEDALTMALALSQ